MQKLLTVEEVSLRLGVSDRTVRNMILRGSLPGAYRLDPHSTKSPYRIPVESVEAIEQARGGTREVVE